MNRIVAALVLFLFCSPGNVYSCADGYTGSSCTAYFPSLDFGTRYLGQSKLDETAITTNDSDEKYRIISVAFSGDAAGDFTTTLTTGAVLVEGIAMTVPVVFTPTAFGTRTATLTIHTVSTNNNENYLQNPMVANPPFTTTVTGFCAVPARAVVIDPAYPDTLYTGISGAGVYISTNSGGTWDAATTQPGNLYIRALVILPGSSATLFAGTYGGGVYTSTDSGVTWDACGNSGLTNLYVLSLVADSAGKLYAGTEAGVFVSADKGATWTAMNSGLPEKVISEG